MQFFILSFFLLLAHKKYRQRIRNHIAPSVLPQLAVPVGMGRQASIVGRMDLLTLHTKDVEQKPRYILLPNSFQRSKFYFQIFFRFILAIFSASLRQTFLGLLCGHFLFCTCALWYAILHLFLVILSASPVFYVTCVADTIGYRNEFSPSTSQKVSFDHA